MTGSRSDQEVVGLVQLASSMLHTGETLGNAGTVICGVDPGEAAFGADAPGALGELFRHLYGQWEAALQARVTEAQRQGARIVGTAERLGKVAANYADTDITLATGIARAVGDVVGDAESDVLRDAEPRNRTLTVRPDQVTS